MWSGTAAGARDGAGNKGGPISSRLPTTQRVARPGSPAPTFPVRRVRPGQPDEHRPCSPPALLVHDGKSGAKTRVQAFRSTWLGLAECDHRGRKPGASQRAGTASHVLAEEDAEWERSRKGRPRSHDASRGRHPTLCLVVRASSSARLKRYRWNVTREPRLALHHRGAAHFGLKECSGACTLAYAQQVATQ